VEASLHAGGGETVPPLLPLAPEERAAGVPLSFAQRRLWYFEQLEPGAPLYHIPAALRATGPLDAARLERAFAAVERRQEALRTVIAAPGGDPLQIVLPPCPFSLPVADLTALPVEEREARARALAAEEGLRPFDLEGGPLWRASLVRLGAEEHLVLLTLHHIVSDGWSMGVLLREVAAVYEDDIAALPDLPVQYADWAVWQQRWLSGVSLERGLAAWKQRLAGAPSLLALPTDLPRPAARTFRGLQHTRSLPAGLADGLQALARREGATLFMVLLAAFQAVLARWSGQRDLIVGTPEAGRDHVDVENLIGFFVNTLPLRGRLAGDPPFRAIVAAARDTVLAAYTHREIPFERLVEELAPERDPGHAPLVQVVLSLGNTPRVPLAFGGVTLAPVDGATATTAKFDLLVAVQEAPDGLGMVWEASADLFDPGSIAGWAHRLEVLLAGVVRDPDLPLADLPLLDAAETALLLTGWSGAAHASPPAFTIPELFAGQVARHPEATAVVAPSGELTYAELAAQSRRLAGRLRASGVGLETPVALRMERSADLLVAALAVLEAGGVAVPLDPAWPAERQSFILADTGVEWILSDGLEIQPASLRQREAGGGGRLLPDHLAAILHTSGSTGQPKGVGVTHRGVSRLVRDVRWARLQGETFLLHSPFTFDASTLEIWGPLLNGGRVVLAPPGPLSPGDLGKLIEHHGVTSVWMTAALFDQCVDEHLDGLRPLRQLLAGGDVLSPSHSERLLAALPALDLINGYGPTENTTFTTTHALRGPQRIAGSIPIGRPIGGTFVRVLDPEMRLAAPGSPGELCAGGAGLTRGYLGRPDLTAERFIPDPFAAEPGTRLYRTGDLVRWRLDGSLEFLGRLDRQVKVRGFRIEPGEIEAVLAASPGVAEAVVVALTDGEFRLAAFVVPAPGAEPTPAALRELLRARLPGYMVPSTITVLDKLPLTSNDKVDRHALERLRPAEAEPSHILPRDPVEEMVASVWADVLGIAVERIGLRDDFFALGGHSLLATRIVSRLRQASGVEVRLREVLERPTVEALAERVRGTLEERTGGPVAPPLFHVLRRTDPPLSFAQLRLWIIDRIEPGSTTYNVALAVRLEGALGPALLAGAFGEVARRHEAVRTTFTVRAGDPVQVVHPPVPVPLPVLDLAALPEAARESEARRLAREEEMRPFDLERGPVLRAGLLRLAPAEHLLLLTLHHIVCDEWSIRLLFHEVVTLYAAWRQGRPAALPPLPVQYADYAVWQRSWLAGPVLESQLAFWRSRLGDPPVLELPTDRPRPPLQTFRGARLSFVLSADASAALFSLSRRRGATAFMTLLAALQALLARTSGQTDLTVGTPITGRTRAEVENLIGFFLNTLVLRADLSGDPGFGVIVDRTRARALEAYAHQDLPFEKLVDELGVRRSLGHSPLFQALFVLLHTTPPEAESAGLRATPFSTEGATAKFDLTLAMHADGESLSGVIEYNTDLFDRTTALRLAERFRVLCAAAAREPHRPLSDLPVLPEPELHQILREHNDRPPRHDVEIRLHDLVAAWAEREPERIAVEWPGGSWTYAEFVGRARGLAGRLRALGVGPDVPVGVSAGRGPALALAFLAILEAGGAYLPIDPAYPRERQDFMLEDSGAPVLLGPEEILAVHPSPARGPGHGIKPAGGEGSAYLIYTSGSTGRPKGIAVTHRVLTNLILWQIDPDRPGAMPGPWRTLQLSSPSFDVSLHEMLSTWCTGGTLVLASDDDRRDPERLARFLAEAGIERLFLPYVALQQLADRLARPDTPVPSRLRRVITAGEQLQVTPQVAEAFRRLSAATGGTTLHNHYGPSETHVVTELILEGDPARWPAVPSIGRPIAGTSAYVLDRALKPLPIGVPGELALGGFSPARGYLGRPDQTAEKFIPDAWSDVPGARLYRSGDLARLLPDGTIEFLGRIDHQVKIRGYRVEPGEIEAVLATHSRVRECAVAVREGHGDRRLVAWFVPDGEVEPTELRDHLRARLPEPMVPTAFVKLDALPLTPSGKVQRSALPAPEGERLAAAPYVEPGTALEREIAAILREELGLDRVGREDNFFDLGGHSLTMVRAAAKLTERLGRPVAVLDLFRTPTVASLARQLGGEEEALPARETLEERAETRRQSLSRRRELRRGR
jgi:amino acid adenylation domain-containing protein